MRWGQPDDWWLAVVPLMVLAAFVYGHLVRRNILGRMGEHALVESLVRTLSMERRLLKQLLFFIAIVLVTLAALRPQYGRRPGTLRQSGIDIAVAFDISKSMLVKDVQPSRLQAAQRLLADLMVQLMGDRIALVPFAGIAFTQSPLTADQGAIRLYMDSLDPSQMPVGGTNLAAAIREGVKLLTGKEDRGDRSSRSRVLLLITDGEDVATDKGEAAKKAAQDAAKAGVSIFAIAVGTRTGDPIPLTDAEGRHLGYQTGSDGKSIYSKINVNLLEDLARLSDPENSDAKRVFQLDGQSSVTAALVTELDTLQKTALKTTMRETYNEKFQYLLLPALLLLLAELLLSERRRGVESA